LDGAIEMAKLALKMNKKWIKLNWKEN
jgi:hypothetical protein